MCAISGLFAREGERERERETVKYSGDDARFFVYACMHVCIYMYTRDIVEDFGERAAMR